ncbi:MAG: hypothetical protein AAF500_19730 [Myxococcota bacterium]
MTEHPTMATRTMAASGPSSDPQSSSRRSAGTALDSRWMLAASVLAVLVAIAWALLDRDPGQSRSEAASAKTNATAKVELLGVPPGAEVTLDGNAIENTLFGVTPGVRHALEVRDPGGRTWRQVFLANGSLSLVVELQDDFVEVPVEPPTD